MPKFYLFFFHPLLTLFNPVFYLTEFSLEAGLILWIVDFLSCRTQQVRVVTSLSDKMMTRTGFPQDCVLSPLLFILYTNSCPSTFPNRHFIKYAVNTALVSLLYDGGEEYGPVLDHFLNSCKKLSLLINKTKTKEMSINFRNLQSFNPTFINGEPIQSVTNYKYLGMVLDSKLKWDLWTDLISTTKNVLFK